MVLSVAGATMSIRAAEAARVGTAAEIKRDTLSRTLGDAVRAITLDDEITVPAGDSTPGHISISSQLQPTKLKSVSRKKALIVAAVVVAAVVVAIYVFVASGGLGCILCSSGVSIESRGPTLRHP
jgi:hypothetical protein